MDNDIYGISVYVMIVVTGFALGSWQAALFLTVLGVAALGFWRLICWLEERQIRNIGKD